MQSSIPSRTVAQALAEQLWALAKHEDFLTYLRDLWDQETSQLPAFVRLYLAEAESGDIPKGTLHSTIQWWEIDDQGFRDSERPEILSFPDDPRYTRDKFYLYPFVRFYVEEDKILIGERYGPRIMSRRQGRLLQTEESVQFVEQKVLWSLKR